MNESEMLNIILFFFYKRNKRTRVHTRERFQIKK